MMLSVIMVSVIILSVIMLNVLMLNVVMLSVVAPLQGLSLQHIILFLITKLTNIPNKLEGLFLTSVSSLVKFLRVRQESLPE